MTGSVHRWTVLAPACLLLVIALAACGLGSGKPDGPGRSAASTTGGHGQTASPATRGGAPHLSGTYVALGDSFTAAPLAHAPGRVIARGMPALGPGLPGPGRGGPAPGVCRQRQLLRRLDGRHEPDPARRR